MGVSGEHRSVRGSWIVTGLTCVYSRLLLRNIFHAFINLSLVSSCIQFDFTPPPQHSYPHVQTSTRLSLSIYQGIRLYSDVYVRNKVEEESEPYTATFDVFVRDISRVQFAYNKQTTAAH